MDATHVVVGDTFKHKDAIKAAGGSWDAARKEWTVPAGTTLPGGLTTRPVSEVRAEEDRFVPGKAEVGEQASRIAGNGKVFTGAVHAVKVGTFKGRPATLEHLRVPEYAPTALFPTPPERHVIVVGADGKVAAVREFMTQAEAEAFFQKNAASPGWGA